MPRTPKRASTLARRATTFEGMNDVLEALAKVIDSTTGDEAKKVFVKAALEARDSIRSLTPVVTSKLRESIFAARGDENLPNALVGVNYKIAPHAHLVEFGHAGPRPAPPHPYFRPGLVLATPKVKQILKDGLLKVIENAPRKP